MQTVSQAQILRDIMGGDMPKARPQTAATSTMKDEQRIKKQLQYLEGIEKRIEEDIEQFNYQRAGRKEKKGVRLTKRMLLEGSQCDELNQI
jgi:hypothetical protein